MNENQTPQPDYNFIVNQSDPTGANSGGGKKRNTKVIVLIILAVVLLMAAIAAIVFSVNPDTPQTNQQSTFISYPASTKDATDSFIAALADANDTDLEKATSYLSTSSSLPEAFVLFSLERMKSSIDFTTCTASSYTKDAGRYNCRAKNGKNVIVTVETSNQSDRIIVSAYRISDE